MPKREDLTGQTFGKLTVIKEGTPHYTPKNIKLIKWICKCTCGNTKEIRASNLKYGDTRSCGCITKKLQYTKMKNRATHKDCNSKEYSCWNRIKSRCTNNKNKSYKYYGGRGITICPEWLNSYEQFLADVGRAPGPKYSIDRIDNNGNYEPNNVKWSSHSEQVFNQNITKRNTSGYVGIYYDKKYNKWKASIGKNKKNYHLGTFQTLKEALVARKQAEEKYYPYIRLLNN